jgi:hypothetical protein
MNFYFNVIDGTVYLDARLEDDDMIGDTHTELARGEKFYGVSYDDLIKAGSGVVVVDKDKGRIAEDEAA